jgi:hypothetical protein
LPTAELEDLQPGPDLAGVIPGQNVAAIAVQSYGADATELTYKTVEGSLGQRVLGRDATQNASDDARSAPGSRSGRTIGRRTWSGTISGVSSAAE